MTVKASAWWLFRGYRGASAPAAYASRVMLPPPLQSSLPAGWLAFTARELNPLDRDEGFQIISSSSLPGLFPGATSENLHNFGLLYRSKQRLFIQSPRRRARATSAARPGRAHGPS